MRLRILTIGKPKLPYAREGVAEYAGRLGKGIEIDHIKASTREQESEALLDRSEGTLRILLDERGQQLTSLELAARIAQWEMQRTKAITFLIGGADGHTDTLRTTADFRFSLSKLTLQHELALLLLLEQIYRARAINAGTPYHRE